MDDGRLYYVATVEINSRVSDLSLNYLYSSYRSSLYVGSWASADVTRVVPYVHLRQMLHQMLVVGVKVGLYGCASEMGWLHCAIIYMSDELLSKSQEFHTDKMTDLNCIHLHRPHLPLHLHRGHGSSCRDE